MSLRTKDYKLVGWGKARRALLPRGTEVGLIEVLVDVGAIIERSGAKALASKYGAIKLQREAIVLRVVSKKRRGV